jgi:hypothetical protein
MSLNTKLIKYFLYTILEKFNTKEFIMKESDLYLPLKQYLESQNYEVKGEVCDCDVVAVREDEAPVIVELKLTLNLDVLLQGVDRVTLSSHIYIGIPHDSKSFNKK